MRRQGCYWIGTISCEQEWEPSLRDGIHYLTGQKEEGQSGYEHWQIFFITERKQSLRGVTRIWRPIIGHWELTRSSAAEEYVNKEETRVGEPFEFGAKPFNRNALPDWELIRKQAKEGNLEEIPADIFCRYYRTFKAIESDYLQADWRECQAKCFWGPTGTGKSSRAWSEAGEEVYPKDPRTKFWCGYRGQENIVCDEFRGGIDISHLLRWLDRYPCTVEIKGGSRPLRGKKFWFTSNVHPEFWYPDCDRLTVEALLRRLEIINIE